MGEFRTGALNLFIVFLFVVLTFQTIFLRTSWLPDGTFVSEVEATESEIFSNTAEIWGRSSSGRPNFRLTSPVLADVAHLISTGVSKLAFWNVVNSPLFEQAPWGEKYDKTEIAKGPMVESAAKLLFFMLSLCSLLFCALICAKRFFTKIILLVLMFLPLLGWPPTYVTVVFNALALFVDLPYYYNLFSEVLFLFDVTSIGILVFMALYISRRSNKKIWEITLITAIVHLNIEYMGLVFGLALAGSRLFPDTPETLPTRIKSSAGALLTVGLASLATAWLSAELFYLGGGEIKNIEGDSLILGLFAKYWAVNGQSLAHFKFILSFLPSLLAPAVIAGMMIGPVIVLIEGRDFDYRAYRRDMIATSGLVVGTLVVFTIGLFLVAYPAEMPREFTPFTVVWALWGMQVSAVLFTMAKAHLSDRRDVAVASNHSVFRK